MARLTGSCGRAWLIPSDAEKPVDGRTKRYQWNDSPYAELLAEVDALKTELDQRRHVLPALYNEVSPGKAG